MIYFVPLLYMALASYDYVLSSLCVIFVRNYLLQV